LIDEYQDTNHAQYRLMKLLAEVHKKITVVGDPDQSIYAWRGADIRNILNFEKDYPECGIIRMEQNYRSTGVILDAANELIKRNQMRKPKVLWTEQERGEKIALFEAQDEREEAQYVVGHILKNRQLGKTLADHVLFYRVHAQSRVFEDVLRRFNIPYKIVGGTRFYDRITHLRIFREKIHHNSQLYVMLHCIFIEQNCQFTKIPSWPALLLSMRKTAKVAFA